MATATSHRRPRAALPPSISSATSAPRWGDAPRPARPVFGQRPPPASASRGKHARPAVQPGHSGPAIPRGRPTDRAAAAPTVDIHWAPPLREWAAQWTTPARGADRDGTPEHVYVEQVLVPTLRYWAAYLTGRPCAVALEDQMYKHPATGGYGLRDFLLGGWAQGPNIVRWTREMLAAAWWQYLEDEERAALLYFVRTAQFPPVQSAAELRAEGLAATLFHEERV